MRVKNRTAMYQVCNGIQVLPWRDAVVPDDSTVDNKIFSIIAATTKAAKTNKVN